ncbi:hypothetical protein HRbin28_02729 [bacterium HR28]|uniref:Uncharacterized protein n=1 Tax=Thermomicrobium roseum TaxID=500 RepID=A0A7C1K524_THERO|nr:hypothetical protein HRbin28_02729 [bacterium HR28]
MADDRSQAQTSRSRQVWNAIILEAQSKCPGVFDLLQAYGGYAQAVREASAYLSLIHVPPMATTSDRTTRG